MFSNFLHIFEYLTEVMDKRILFIFLIFIGLLSSCTREYICQCKIKYTGATPGLPDSTLVEYKLKNNRKEAISQCKANSFTSTKDGITLTEDCKLY